MEHARDVTIKLHHRIGRYVQVHLYFALRWIMLSEVTFITGKSALHQLTNLSKSSPSQPPNTPKLTRLSLPTWLRPLTLGTHPTSRWLIFYFITFPRKAFLNFFFLHALQHSFFFFENCSFLLFLNLWQINFSSFFSSSVVLTLLLFRKKNFDRFFLISHFSQLNSVFSFRFLLINSLISYSLYSLYSVILTFSCFPIHVVLFLAPVLGNFTEEEVNGSTLPQDTLEYPLQRDEVQTHHTKGERNNHQVPQSKLLFCCFITYFCALYVFVVVFIFISTSSLCCSAFLLTLCCFLYF